tara:strand:+ start:375 stop:671 length:297 start_codon:yes stop_codon:yes gene_type:complete
MTEPGFKKKSRGGLRSNSSTMHLQKKVRKYRCEWCDKKMTSSREKKFCSLGHRQDAYRLNKAIREKRRLTNKARKHMGGFRPPSRELSSLLLKARKIR